jgi:RNA polymerase sigma-70 factor (ECF subfamily)
MKLTDPHAEAFETHRSMLTGVAYRMLGSVSDAEDMVQEAWLRWTRVDAATVTSPKSWLLTVVSRLCLDYLKSARVKREEYHGTWLPEPLVGRVSPSPTDRVDESVSIALLLVLEKLSPVERAGFLLHEVFGHSFEEIGEILGKPAVNCRKLVSRARERVRAEKPRFSATASEHDELLRRFLTACRDGEMDPLMDMLGDGVAFYSDGGGKAAAVPRVLTDREEIATFFIKVSQVRAKQPERFEIRSTSFNGAPGVLIVEDGQVITAMSVEVHEGKITAIFAHRNPDKLRAFRD